MKKAKVGGVEKKAKDTKAPKCKLKNDKPAVSTIKSGHKETKDQMKKATFTSSMDTADLPLFIELYENMNKGDDIKALAICRLLMEIYPNDTKLKEFGDVLFESLKHEEEPIEPEMDPHMKLNADGEYEYFYSSEEDN